MDASNASRTLYALLHGPEQVLSGETANSSVSELERTRKQNSILEALKRYRGGKSMEIRLLF